MSSFILSSEVVHESSAVVSGITFIGMDRGRDSGKEEMWKTKYQNALDS